MKPEHTACTSKAAPWAMPSRDCTTVAVAGKLSSGVVVKSHGGADAVGFASAVDMAIDMARADINARIKADRTAITAESAGARAAEL